jgi:uncharacterized protein YjbJ (UPF0337 family)
MNESILKGKWHQAIGVVKRRWGRLTDDDLRQIDGEAERLYGKLEERYGLARDEAKRRYREFERNLEFDCGAT